MLRTRTLAAAAACVIALLVAAASAGGQQSNDKKTRTPTAAQLKIARSIAGGHAYEKHVIDEKLFPEVKTKSDFADVIARVLANPTHQRKLENDREAFYDSKSNTIVIYNPHARDKGTCFRPRAGLRYYDGLK